MSQNPSNNLPAADAGGLPHSPGAHTTAPQPKGGNGLGVAALVVGIVAVVLSIIPLLGMVAFFLGPVAIILGLIGVFLKNRKRGMALTGVILGIASLIIAGVMTAAIAAGVKAANDKMNAEHTIEYMVTTDGPAHISYWTSAGSSSEDITANWTKTITTNEWNVTSLTVTGDLSNSSASVGCEILIDGESVAKNSGSGSGAMASCSGSTWSGK